MTGDGRALSYGAPSRLFPDGEPVLGPRLIVPHKKEDYTFLVAVGVHPSLVRAELRRKMTNRLPIAEDNRTVVRGCRGLPVFPTRPARRRETRRMDKSLSVLGAVKEAI
jgi:hypothetical protein